MSATALKSESIIYPDSDGKPMADNTLQFDWIVVIENGLEALFADNPDVFVAGDLLWYPVEGDNKIRVAPDAMVAFGRPKGYRGSYQQWREAGIAPQVVFEVLSPGNTRREMAKKLDFYERHGVEEYYLYDPDGGTLQGWLHQDKRLQAVATMRGWVSPRLNVRFDLEGKDLCMYDWNGERFQSYLELKQQLNVERQHVETERQRAETERQRAEKATDEHLAAIPRLHKLGLSIEQIAAALNVSQQTVRQHIDS